MEEIVSSIQQGNINRQSMETLCLNSIFNSALVKEWVRVRESSNTRHCFKHMTCSFERRAMASG